MWRTAETDQGIHARYSFWQFQASSPYSTLCLRHAHPFVAAEEKKAVSCREAEGLVTESDMLLWLQGHLSWHLAKSPEAMNNCRDSASGQGWRRGCQPFSCRCSLNVMHCRKEIYGTCLSKESMPFVKSKPPLPSVPEAWGPWEPQHPPPSHYGCIMLAKDRVVVSKIWTTGYWLWSWLFCICDCWKSMKNCRDSSLSLRGLEARLPAFKLPMFAKCDALPKQIKEIPAILFGNFKHPVPTLHYACVMPIPLLQLQKKDLSMQRSRGFGQGVVVPKICYVQHSDCDLSCGMRLLPTNEIELLATASWSCRWSRNVTYCQKETCSTCLFQTYIPAIPFAIPSIHSLPEAWGPWERQHALPALHYACKRSHPFVAASEKSTCLMQRSKAFGHAVGWKRGCQPFSYRCSQNVRHCRKEICWTCLFKKSIPAILFWISKHPLPARSRFLRAAVRSTMSWSTLGMLTHSQASRVVHVAISS